jgi:serine/threonine-protein phosphatase 6 regulatory subunit 3
MKDETESTSMTTLVVGGVAQVPDQVELSNKYHLFERLLNFLDCKGDLNPVLAGYFAKLMLILISNKSAEVYRYVFTNPHLLDKFVQHLGSKSVSEVLQKLLNVSESLSGDEEGATSD